MKKDKFLIMHFLDALFYCALQWYSCIGAESNLTPEDVRAAAVLSVHRVIDCLNIR